ncbi:hypothetical protein ACFVZZ_24595, partial [Streptomyces chartreusis]|uniref:hypothetical protein n=1 Tax=Streptomyces chartreusis TaxID=1969 RepID=UPI0036DDEBD1
DVRDTSAAGAVPLCGSTVTAGGDWAAAQAVPRPCGDNTQVTPVICLPGLADVSLPVLVTRK